MPEKPCSRGQVRLLLVEDQALVRESLARTLADDPAFCVVAQCASVAEALEEVASQSVDVVLLDLQLGAVQGGAFLNTCVGAGFRGHVLVVTGGVGEREAAWLLRRGCSGIFLKQNPLDELVAKIHSLAGTPSPLADESLREPEAVTAGDGRVRPRLTVREREVLRCVCEGLASKEIAAKLDISEASVKSFLQQLFHKTGVRTRAQLVRAAIEEYWDEMEAE